MEESGGRGVGLKEGDGSRVWSIECRGRGLNLAWFRLEGKKDEDIAKNGGGWRDEDRRPPMSAKEMEEADARDNAEGAERLVLVGQRGGDGGRGERNVAEGRGWESETAVG